MPLLSHQKALMTLVTDGKLTYDNPGEDFNHNKPRDSEVPHFHSPVDNYNLRSTNWASISLIKYKVKYDHEQYCQCLTKFSATKCP